MLHLTWHPAPTQIQASPIEATSTGMVALSSPNISSSSNRGCDKCCRRGGRWIPMIPGFSWNDGLHERFGDAWPPGSARTPLQEGSLPVSRLYFTGLQDDGNGNSRSQPPQGTDPNGMSSSDSTAKLTTVCKTLCKLLASGCASRAQTCLKQPIPFQRFGGASMGTGKGSRSMCHGKHPLRALLCPVARMHMRGTAEPALDHPQGILLQAATEPRRISGAWSSCISQPADGRGNSVPQVADTAPRGLPSTHTA